MTAEERVYAAINVAGVQALAGARIYPDAIPLEKGLPALSYIRISTELQLTLSSQVAAERAAFDLWCMARTRSAADALAAAVQTACLAESIIPTGRRAEFDIENEIFGTVLSIDVWD